MKTISISILFLVVYPMQLLAQDSSRSAAEANSYFRVLPIEFYGDAKHIVEATTQSNRKGTTSLDALSTKATIPRVSKTPAIASESSSMIQQTAKLQIVEVAPPAAEVVSPPKVLSEEISKANEVMRPTPENSAPQPDPIANTDAQPMPESNGFKPQANQQTYRDDVISAEVAQRVASEAPESVSMDELQMLQRMRSWQQRPQPGRRDVVDHFSPGGEPFASPGVVGNPNFFGVDRHGCCDEWEGFCNCSGGLKVNPGHLGLPWLRDRRDNCDQVKPICGNCRKCKSRKGCECSECNR